MVMRGDWSLGNELTVGFTDFILSSFIPGTHIMLSTNVTPIHFIKI